jgi:Flp pilus assembly protein TadD
MKTSLYGNGALACALALLAFGASPAHAGLFGRNHAAAPAATAAGTASYAPLIQRALAEQRLLDAGRLLDQAVVSGDRDPGLAIFAGQLSLARGRYADALANFKRVENNPALKGDSLEGQGLALALLGRSEEALAVLQKAVAEKPSAWRAWNALGSEYDARRRWPEADAAYERAVSESNRAAIVLNNRGFSRMLQGRQDEAIRDFVEALGTKPDLAAARTNLRMAMAMRGEYQSAVAGAPREGEAASLNNAGFAAMVRGDYPAAEGLFDRAMAAKGEYYARAATNLQLVRSLKTQADANREAAPHAR